MVERVVDLVVLEVMVVMVAMYIIPVEREVEVEKEERASLVMGLMV